MFYTIYSFQIEINSKNALIEELENKLASLENNSSGGAEVPLETEYQTSDNFLFPILEEDYLITSPYGVRVSPILNIEMKHQGLDVTAVHEAQVVSIADGVILEHWPPPGTPYPSGGVYEGHPVYGGTIIIEHDDGFKSLYAHLSWTRVFTGQRIRQGEIIGRIGDTGVSTGQHLHLEVLYNDENVNPLLYIDLPE